MQPNADDDGRIDALRDRRSSRRSVRRAGIARQLNSSSVFLTRSTRSAPSGRRPAE